MKALKVIGILLLVIVGIGLIASLVLPKDMEISKSIEINAPMDVVWRNVSSWEKIDKWSPWYKEDPDMKVTFEGEPGTLSSKFSWIGNKNVGSGHQLFKSIDADSHKIETEVVFKEPWEGKGDANFKLEEVSEGVTKMTWDYKSHVGIPGNLFSALFNAKGMLSEMYDLGLSKLKVIAEKEHLETPAVPTFDIALEERRAIKYVGKKELVKMDSAESYFMKNMSLLGAAVGKENMAGVPCGLYWTWDVEKGESEMSCAVPIKGEKAPKGYEIYEVPAGSFLVINYFGPYEGIGAAHEAMETYMNKNEYTFNGPAIEEYMNDPMLETDSAKLHTRVVYPVAKKVE